MGRSNVASLILISVLVVALASLPPDNVLGHDVLGHSDPELLTGWRTWFHLTIQWAHLVSFALWIGLTVGTLLLGIKPSLDYLLYTSWVLFLILLATGTYNMEYSAGISETPSLLLLPLLERIPYGVTYTVVLAVKVGLYILAVFLTLIITVLHLKRFLDEARLRRMFLRLGSMLAVLLTLAASVVLFYHEAADLWPTRLHSLGGVMGPQGPRGQAELVREIPPPNDFLLLTTRQAWIDIGLRFVHLLGFGLWLGSSAWLLVVGGVSVRRFLFFLWAVLIVQILSGVASMARWPPFYLPPYAWNLNALSDIRFGRSYTLFMALKHVLVIAGLISMMIAGIRYLKLRRKPGTEQLNIRPLVLVNLLLALAIGYIMMIVLLLHEGVDHAL